MGFVAMPSGGTRVQRRALVVEDDGPSCHALVRILELHGCDVIWAHTRNEAFHQLGKNPTHLLLDLHLPDGNGLEVLRRIRQLHLPVRVAVITGAGIPVLAPIGSLRPDALFTKPLHVCALLDWLDTPRVPAMPPAFLATGP